MNNRHGNVAYKFNHSRCQANTVRHVQSALLAAIDMLNLYNPGTRTAWIVYIGCNTVDCMVGWLLCTCKQPRTTAAMDILAPRKYSSRPTRHQVRDSYLTVLFLHCHSDADDSNMQTAVSVYFPIETTITVQFSISKLYNIDLNIAGCRLCRMY